MPHVKKLGFAGLVIFVGCSAPTPPTPSLTPQLAAQLLHFDNKAEAWLTVIRKQNPACGYKIELPDQSSHPNEIDADHIVSCGNQPTPREFDASVVFVYDKAAQRWTVSRFSS
jgi:hypothetical protein